MVEKDTSSETARDHLRKATFNVTTKLNNTLNKQLETKIPRENLDWKRAPSFARIEQEEDAHEEEEEEDRAREMVEVTPPGP